MITELGANIYVSVVSILMGRVCFDEIYKANSIKYIAKITIGILFQYKDVILPVLEIQILKYIRKCICISVSIQRCFFTSIGISIIQNVSQLSCPLLNGT